jgi:hypothetical protein
MIIGQGGENQDYKAAAAIARRESGVVSILTVLGSVRCFHIMKSNIVI